jgi:hypothetical protein
VITLHPSFDRNLRVLVLTGISRVVASHRDGRWDDTSAPTLPLQPSRMTAVIADFGQLPAYGWDSIDAGNRQFNSWKDWLSFDVRCAGGGGHTLDLFQENGHRILDFRVWFDSLRVSDRQGTAIAITDFISDGVRWWDALHAHDPRIQGPGILPG